MKRASTADRLKRLENVAARLKDDELCTIGDIAEDLGVSVRTISRDIQVLRDQGLPIDADRGRGGGVRLDRRWGIGRVNLTYSEAVDLLVSLAVAEQMKSPLLMAHLGSVRRKLMASFSPATKHKVSGLKARILIGESASPFVLSAFNTPNRQMVEQLHQAFVTMQAIAVTYRAESGAKTERVIEPHFLLLNYPVWYVLAWDQLRSSVRTFRCDRIESIRRLDEGFQLLPIAKFENALDGVNVI